MLVGEVEETLKSVSADGGGGMGTVWQEGICVLVPPPTLMPVTHKV
jgi:hypothetical protein